MRSGLQLLGLAALVSLTAVVAACSDDSAATSAGCTPGEQTSCACPGGTQGIQSCNTDGSGFSACQCSASTCGNGQLDLGEDCDDGNSINDDACSNLCKNASCGDGIVQDGEDCDDGGAEDGELNTCPSNCLNGGGTGGGGAGGNGAGGGTPDPVCGNGAVEGTEACDDGNTDAGDGCAADCVVEMGFSCMGNPSICEPNCGNGTLDATELCDDGNNTAGDGCAVDCTIEDGYECPNNLCQLICGNGTVNPGEACDDGNNVSGDGCQDDCTLPTCVTDPIFAGIVPTNGTVGNYIGSAKWQYQANLGTMAGDALCNLAKLGSHVCTYAELKKAGAKVVLPNTVEVNLKNLASNTTMWLHRTTVASEGNVMNSTPGAGGRCNDWQYLTNHISDGEYVQAGMNGALTYFLDPDTFYDGVSTAHVQGTLQCGGTTRAIPCCYTCED
jgi:cysteine-rich repeat protein